MPRFSARWFLIAILMAPSITFAGVKVVKPAEPITPGLSNTGTAYVIPGPQSPLSSLENLLNVLVPNVYAASTTVGELWRWPAGKNYTFFQTMENATAYYRDAFVAQVFSTYGAVNGDTWRVTATLPGGRIIDWGTMQFYASYGGNTNCFVWGWVICGGTSITVYAYTPSQCLPNGEWTFNVYANAALVGANKFTMLPEVPPHDVVTLSQVTNPESSYDGICYTLMDGKKVKTPCTTPGAIPYTIKQKGCALACTAMVSGYHGFNIGPDAGIIAMNNALTTSGGYDQDGNIKWKRASEYSGRSLFYIGRRDGQDDQALKQDICQFGPQAIAVKNTTHFVLATGRDKDETTWKISDPATGTVRTLQAYGNVYNGVRRFRGPEQVYTDNLNQITFYLYSPAELMITDSQGRRSGLDPISGVSYNEIPGSSYGVEGIGVLEDDGTISEDEDNKTKALEMIGIPDGEYILQVTGTGMGAYDLEIDQTGPDGKSLPTTTKLNDIPTQPGEMHKYSIQYSATATQPASFAGSFDGGGQQPTDMNKFLRYSTPTQSRTQLPTGSTQTRIMLSYGSTTLPETFVATLNGANVTSLFAPAPGKFEGVTLPLQKGSNTLVLSINGKKVSGHIAADTDRLVFLVP